MTPEIERRKRERRAGCIYPECPSGMAIDSAHEEIERMLGELKEGQHEIIEIAKRQVAVMTSLEIVKKDVEDLKVKVYAIDMEMVSKKDITLYGKIIIGLISILATAFIIHSFINK